MTRVQLEVLPVERLWLVRVPGDGVSEFWPHKHEAIARARQIGGWHDEWSVRVLTDGGDLESEIRSPPPASS